MKQLNLEKDTEVVLSVEHDAIMIKPVHIIPPREEWNALFTKAIKAGERPEHDVFEGLENKSDQNEWTWES